MTIEQQPKLERFSILWQPTDEMITKTIEALKNTQGNLWEEFKAVEVNVGHLMNDTGYKLVSKIQELNPDIGVAEGAILKMRLREIVRKEAGLPVKERTSRKETE